MQKWGLYQLLLKGLGTEPALPGNPTVNSYLIKHSWWIQKLSTLISMSTGRDQGSEMLDALAKGVQTLGLGFEPRSV